MKDLIEKINNMSSITDHYLVKALLSKHDYLREFLEAANTMKSLMTPKEFEYWCGEKMLLKNLPFAEKTFIQYAVETAVVRFFGDLFPVDFKIEAKINSESDKDVDCQFKHGEFVYNIEVKCSDFVSKEKVDLRDGYKYETIGRLPDKGQEAIQAVSSALDESHIKKGEQKKEHIESKKMDNNLKDFLVLAHNKFNRTPNENEINVLMIGCDNERDIQNWIYYLHAEQGLFTTNSFAPRENYNNVDLVVLTNQYFKHNKFFNKSVRNCWTLDEGFNLIFVNPNRQLVKEKGIKNFLDILPNYTEALGRYVVPGDAPDFVKDSVRVSWFVKDYLERQHNTYVFGQQSSGA